jgi:sugar lactone lactonase YvrE
MAGGNGAGSALNQLHFPSGIFLDDDSNLYIADGFNHRIVKWISGSSSGQIIAGDNEGGNRSNQFHYPTSLTIDKNGTMFVVDGGNRRIQRWYKNANQGETILSNISSWGLSIDNQNSLYYSNSIEKINDMKKI